MVQSAVYGQAAAGGLVTMGADGLEYKGYANEGQTNAVNTVPDFSSAGYQGGGVPIPFIPAKVTIRPGRGDNAALIQKAIDKVSAMPAGKNGFRGAVLLKAGDYKVGRTLNLAAGGVIIRGEGSQERGGSRIIFTADRKSDLFTVSSRRGTLRKVNGSGRILDAYVPVGAKSFHVANASDFTPGDMVIIENTMNHQWIDDLSDMGQWGWRASDYQLQFRRTVVAVEGDRITVDAPVLQAIEEGYGGGVIYRYERDGGLENIGFEGLRLESVFKNDEDEKHGWAAVRIRGVENGWVRQVTGCYFGFGLVSIEAGSRKITVEDCAMLDPKSKTTGGRKYSFNINDSAYVLVQRCLTRGGRHDFVSGSKTPGPNAFVDCRANEPQGDCGPHHRYSTGQLYDNIMCGELNVRNRGGSGTGHGWAGAQTMFWNCSARSIICDAPAGAMNWCVGSSGQKKAAASDWSQSEPCGIWESHNRPVQPRSLYYAQLADRLGADALHRVLLPEQKAGTVWAELSGWNGDGLFLDGLTAWAETGAAKPGQPVSIYGRVRNLELLERRAGIRWRKVSGPGTVSFANKNALETQAVFSRPGPYVIRLTAAGEPKPADLEILIRSE